MNPRLPFDGHIFNNINLHSYFQTNSAVNEESDSYKLIFLFKDALKSTNPHYESNLGYFKAFTTRFKHLTRNEGTPSGVTNEIIEVYGKVLYSIKKEDTEISEKLINYILKSLNADNLYRYLKIAFDSHNEILINMCLKVIINLIYSQYSENSIYFKEGIIYFHINPAKLVVSLEEVQKHLKNLKQITSDIHIKYEIQHDAVSLEMHQLFIAYGSDIHTLIIKNNCFNSLNFIKNYSPNVEYIKFKNCELNASLCNLLVNFKSLKTLTLDKTHVKEEFLKLLPQISIESLELFDCEVTRLDYYPPHLNVLDIKRCHHLTAIAPLPQFMEYLGVQACDEFSHAPVFHRADVVTVTQCPKIESQQIKDLLAKWYDKDQVRAVENWFNFDVSFQILATWFINTVGINNFHKAIPKIKNRYRLPVIEEAINYMKQIGKDLKLFLVSVDASLAHFIITCGKNHKNMDYILEILRLAMQYELKLTIYVCLKLLNQHPEIEFSVKNNSKIALKLYSSIDLKKNQSIIDHYIKIYNCEVEFILDVDDTTALTNLNHPLSEFVTTIVLNHFVSYEYLTKFQALSSLHLYMPNITLENFANFAKLTNITNLTIVNYQDDEINFQLPLNLKALTLKSCPGMKGLPELPASVSQLKLRDCDQITDQAKLHALGTILVTSKSDLFVNCFKTHVKNINALTHLIFNNLTLVEIAIAIGKCLNKKLNISYHKELALALLNELLSRNFNFFVANLSAIFRLTTSFLEYGPLLKSDLWQQSYNLVPDRIKQTLFPELGFIQYVDIPDRYIEELLQIFDRINFTLPAGQDYIDPNSIKVRGKIIKVEDIKAGLITLINHINHNKPFRAIPKDENECFNWYRQLEYALKLFLKVSNESPDNYTQAKRVISIAGTVSLQYCATAWKDEAIEAIQAFQEINEIKPDGVINHLISWFDDYKKLIMHAITKRILFRNLNVPGNEVHIYNGIAQKMLEKGFQLPSSDTLDLKDPLTPIWTTYSPRFDIDQEISRAFKFFHVSSNISKRITNELATNPHFSGQLLEYFKDIAHINLREKMQGIEESLNAKRKIFGLSQVKLRLEETKMDIAVLTQDSSKMAEFSQRLLIPRKQALKRKMFESMEANNRPQKKQKVTDTDLMNEETFNLNELHRLEKEMIVFQSYENDSDNYKDEIEMLVDNETVARAIQEEKSKECEQFLTENHLLTFNEYGDIKLVTPAGILELLKHLKFLSLPST
jgi:hypothetical protein